MSLFSRLTLSSGKRLSEALQDGSPRQDPTIKDDVDLPDGAVVARRLVLAPAPRGRGRPSKTKARLLTEEDLAKVTELEQRYAPCVKAQNRVLQQYDMFLELNGLDGRQGGLRSYVGVLLSDGLAISSIDTYVGYIVGRYKSADNRHTQKAVQRAHADQDCKSAPDVPRDVLQLVVARIKKPRLRRMAYLLFLTGARPVTLQRARRIAFNVHGQDYSFGMEVRLDKTHKARSERDYLIVPREMVPEAFRGKRFLEDLWNFPEDRPFEKVKVGVLNRALMLAAKDICEPAPTTYSFRRAYIHELMKRYAPNGDVTAIKKYTLHTDVRCLKAHYVNYKEVYGVSDGAADDEDE